MLKCRLRKGQRHTHVTAEDRKHPIIMKPGDVVKLTSKQYEAFKDKFVLVPMDTSEDVIQEAVETEDTKTEEVKVEDPDTEESNGDADNETSDDETDEEEE